MGHQGKCDAKVQSIEYLDERIIRPICEGLEKAGEPYRMLILPDHPTPLRIRTHVADPVPYLLYDSRNDICNTLKYNEKEAKEAGIYLEYGYTLMDRLINENC